MTKLEQRVGLIVRLQAKPDQADRVATFLTQAVMLANKEAATPYWIAYKLPDASFGIFDIHNDDTGRQAHLAGEIAATIMANAAVWLAAPPQIEFHEVLSAKLGS